MSGNRISREMIEKLASASADISSNIMVKRDVIEDRNRILGTWKAYPYDDTKEMQTLTDLLSAGMMVRFQQYVAAGSGYAAQAIIEIYDDVKNAKTTEDVMFHMTKFNNIIKGE